MFNIMLWNYRLKAALGGSRWCDYYSSFFATLCFSRRRELCIRSHYFSSFQSMHKSVLSSREEEPFNLNPEMKSFIPFQTALWPIRLGKQVSLALLSKRSSPSLCRDVNSHYPVTVMLAAWDGGKEGIKCIHVCFFNAIQGEKSQYLRLLSVRCPSRREAVLFQSRKPKKGGQATMRWAQQACSDLLPASAPAQPGMWRIPLGWGSGAGVQTSHFSSYSFFLLFEYCIWIGDCNVKGM